MKICVHSEFLARSQTSANPSRGMFRHLMKLRPSDQFQLIVGRGSE